MQPLSAIVCVSCDKDRKSTLNLKKLTNRRTGISETLTDASTSCGETSDVEEFSNVTLSIAMSYAFSIDFNNFCSSSVNFVFRSYS